MFRRSIAFAALLAGWASLAGAAETAQLRGGSRCPEGHPETGDIGLEYLLCVGGSCSVNLRRDRGYAHDFSMEPSIGAIRPGSPAAGKLRDRDILVAIDGVLITTREGGRRLANLTPGDPVTLRIRRQGEEMDVTVVPELGCNAPRLTVLDSNTRFEPVPGPTPPGQPRRFRVVPAKPANPAAEATPEPPVAPTAATPPARPNVLPRIDFGMELECRCGWYTFDQGKTLQWYSPDAPIVHSVEPGGPADRAGIRPGDVLLQADGRALTTAQGGRYLGTVSPGQEMTLRVRRGKETLSVNITPRAPRRSRQPF